MTTKAPGVYTTVTAAVSSSSTGAETGQWFVTGITQQGPVGVPVPITSMNDYVAFLGPRTQATDSFNTQYNLYDALDEYFHDGGVTAYVSRVVGPGAATARNSVVDGSSITSLSISAAGPGAWGNNISIIIVNNGTYYNMTVQNNGVTIVTSPNLFYPIDAQNWFNAQNLWEVQIVVTAGSGGNPVSTTVSLNSGSDDNSHITDTQWTNALGAFTESYGPGQVSAPGHTTVAGYVALAAHAATFNRVALLDVADSSSASTLVSQAQAIQANTAFEDYASFFAPWVIIPGVSSANPGASSPVPNRVIPPSALAAALMSANDVTHDTNNPAAGPNGQSSYAIGVTQTYAAADRATLNNASVNVIRNINGTITIYGYRSLSTDPSWTYLNNVRMRMQMIYDFDQIGENYLFEQIDGKGQLFSTFNGALAGQCQKYWVNGSLYGATAQQAFNVNTGPQVNTPTTIANSQINALISVRLSPFAETVNINVAKYLTNATIPNSPGI
jgi:hypothetical protein